MTPSTGAWKVRSTSSIVFTLVSRYSMKKARPMPMRRPKTSPSTMLTRLVGFDRSFARLRRVGDLHHGIFGQAQVDFLRLPAWNTAACAFPASVPDSAWRRSMAGSFSPRHDLFVWRFHRIRQGVEGGLRGIDFAFQAGHDADHPASISRFSSSIKDCTRVTTKLVRE